MLIIIIYRKIKTHMLYIYSKKVVSILACDASTIQTHVCVVFYRRVWSCAVPPPPHTKTHTLTHRSCVGETEDDSKKLLIIIINTTIFTVIYVKLYLIIIQDIFF